MIAELFEYPEIYFLFNLLICSLAGFMIGLERESRHKDAGISTHMLVILGSMLFTYLSTTVDPESTSRIAAQVVTGIGFLGAGLIIKDGGAVKNLTTAASLWFAAAIGMAFGFGYFLIGFFATLVAVFIPRIPHICGSMNCSGDEG
jgi:putative Mg2+ transporter-C (MgtC) family protein